MLLVLVVVLLASGATLWRYWSHSTVSSVRHAPLAVLTALALTVVATQTAQIWVIATDTGRLPAPGPEQSLLGSLWGSRGAIALEIGWYAYVAAAAALFASLLLGSASEQATLDRMGRLGAGPRLARRALEWMERGSTWALKRLWLTGPALIGLFLLSWGGLIPDPMLEAVGWDREGFNAFAMLVLFALATTLVANWVDRDPNRPVAVRPLDHAWSLTSNALLLMVVFNEAVWVEASSGGLVSGRNHFVTALLGVAFAGVALAHLLDRTRGTDVRPSAVVLVPAAFLVVVTSWDSWIGHESTAEAASAVVDCSAEGETTRRQQASMRWLESVDARLNQIPDDGPVFVVAASGGGTRAAIYTTLTLAWLQASKVRCMDTPEAPLNEVSAPLLPTEERDDRPERVQFLAASAAAGEGLDKHVLLISSVSGGSLGSAYYWSHPEDFSLGEPGCDPATMRHVAGSWVVPTYQSLRDEAEHHTLEAQRFRVAEEHVREALEKELLASGDAFVSETVDAAMRSPQVRSQIEAEFRKLSSHASPDETVTHPLYGFPNAPANFEPLGERAVCSMFLDKVGQNFASPTVRGALLPFASRGDELEKAWTGGNLLRRNVTGTSPESSSPDRPLLVLNAFDVRTGGSVVVGMPALPPWLLHSAPDDTANGYALPPIAPLDVAEGMDLSLAKAVRASAAVPLLFDPVRASSSCAPTDADGERREASLTLLDGGAYDNTGIDTLDAIIPMLTDKARQERFVLDAFATNEDRDAARALLAKIRRDLARRGGPILVEVDSTARPAPYSESVSDAETTTFAQPGSDVLLGWEALSRATFQHARAATLSMLASLSATKPAEDEGYRRRWPPVDQVPDGIVRLIYSPDVLDKPGHDVMSFWALGPTDIAYLLYAFDHTRITAEADMQREVATACDAGAAFRLSEQREALLDVGQTPEPTPVSVAWCGEADDALVTAVLATLDAANQSGAIHVVATATQLPPAITETLEMEDTLDVRATLDESGLATVLSEVLTAGVAGSNWPVGLRAPSWGAALTVVVCHAPESTPPSTQPDEPVVPREDPSPDAPGAPRADDDEAPAPDNAP